MEGGSTAAGPSRAPQGNGKAQHFQANISDRGTASDDEGSYESDSESEEDDVPQQQDPKGKRPAVERGNSQKPSKGITSWTDLDLSIIVALVSPIGNWLTGGDHIKNLFLVILLIFYLHQIIEVPWQMYLAARPRRSARLNPQKAKHDDKTAAIAALAQNELRSHELFYLGLSIVSPFIGSTFLRHVLAALGDSEALSWFSTTLFVLATGIRPWSHLVSRLNDRTKELHDALHYPSEDSPARQQAETEKLLRSALKRVSALEHDVLDLRETLAHEKQLREVCDDLSEALDEVERGAKRNERKAENARAAQSVRLATLETALVRFEEQRRRDLAAFEAAGFRFPKDEVLNHALSLGAKILSFPLTIWSLGGSLRDDHSPTSEKQSVFANGNGNGASRGIRSPDREKHLPLLQQTLETIPEAENSDSEGTYVSDKEPTTPTKPRRRLSESGRVRSRVRKARDEGSRVVEQVQEIVLWPYRFSVRVLVALLPPLRKILPAYGL